MTLPVRFYAGKGFGPEPSFTLCATQASLLDGVLPLYAFVFIFNLPNIPLNHPGVRREFSL